MPYDRDKQHRRSIRLKGYDYATAGAYFITICTWRREYLFGAIDHEGMHVNTLGAIVQKQWQNLPAHYPTLVLDSFVVMPNHVHGIVILADPEETPSAVNNQPRNKTSPPLTEIVRAFKSYSARYINTQRGTTGLPVWQRNYYEHIIRDDESLNRIRKYIADNPFRWEFDPENQSKSHIQ